MKQFNENIEFNWELQKARFQITNSQGYTVGIWITTGFFESELEAKEVWEKALCLLTCYLNEILAIPSLETIY